MMFLLWPLLFNPPLWPVAIAVGALTIGVGLQIANVNPILGLIVVLF